MLEVEPRDEKNLAVLKYFDLWVIVTGRRLPLVWSRWTSMISSSSCDQLESPRNEGAMRRRGMPGSGGRAPARHRDASRTGAHSRLTEKDSTPQFGTLSPPPPPHSKIHRARKKELYCIEKFRLEGHCDRWENSTRQESRRKEVSLFCHICQFTMFTLCPMLAWFKLMPRWRSDQKARK